jgi:hypothetical protein
VSNGNSDLKTNGGTVVVVDMMEAMHRLSFFWSADATGMEELKDTCRYAPQSYQMVECHEEDMGSTPGVVMSDLTVRTGFYPGFIALEKVTESACGTHLPAAETGELRYRLYTPVRGDPSLTYIDVITSDSSEVECLDCGDGCTTSEVRDCKGSYRLEAPSKARQGYVHSTLPAEPFGLALESAGGFLILAHLAGGSLSLVDLCGDPVDDGWRRPDLVDVLLGVMGQDVNGRSGGFNVVQRDATDPCGWFYVSNRAAAQLMTLRVSEDPDPAADRGLRLVMGPSVILTAPFGPLESGADLRGMAMANPDRLFVLSRTPPSLLVLDTTLEDGQPRNEVLDVVEICPKPSVLRVRMLPAPDGRTLAYAVCFASGEIYVVDTHDAQVVDRIETGGGPHDLAIMPDSAPSELQGFGLVSNFGEHTVGVIDLRPESETYHQMIGRLGWPEELMQ